MALQGQAHSVEIMRMESVRLGGNVEQVILDGIAERDAGQGSGFSLICRITWRTEEYAFDEQNDRANSYFTKVKKQHVDNHATMADAILEMTFYDTEFGDRVGNCSGFLKFHGRLKTDLIILVFLRYTHGMRDDT